MAIKNTVTVTFLYALAGATLSVACGDDDSVAETEDSGTNTSDPNDTDEPADSDKPSDSDEPSDSDTSEDPNESDTTTDTSASSDTTVDEPSDEDAGGSNGQDASDDSTATDDSPDGGDNSDDGGAATETDAGNTNSDDAVYITAVRVWAQDSTIQYVKLSRELDTNFEFAEFEDAYEFGGYAGIIIEDGYVIVGDDATPFMHKFRVTEDLKLEEVEDPLNFQDYYTADGDGLNAYYQARKGNDQLFFYGAERTSRLHFKLTEWAYAGAYEDTNLPIREGWELGNAGNRTGVKDFQDAVVWPFVLAPMDGVEGTPESYLAVYDGTTFAETSIIEPTCPDLNWSTMDEDGNLYFSTRSRSPLYGLYGTSAPNCVVKVKPDGTVDESFGANGELSFEALTGGLSGVAFRYIGDGKAVAAMLNVDALEGADFTGALQEEVFCQAEACEETPELENLELWEWYVIDLETKTATRMTGYDPDYPGFGNYRIYWNVDGRTYFMGYHATSTDLVMYELDSETGVVSIAGNSPTPPDASHEYTQLARIR